MNLPEGALWSSFMHFSFGTSTKAKHLNTQRCFTNGFVPGEALYGVLPTTNRLRVQFLRQTASETADVQYFFKSPALTSMHHTCSIIMRYTRSTTPLDFGMLGVFVSFSMQSDFRSSANFLEVYYVPPSVPNRVTCLADSLSLRACHSLNFSSASELYCNVHSAIWLIVLSIKSSIYWPPPMAVSNGLHMSMYTSCSGSVLREVEGVTCFWTTLHLMQLSQLHFLVIVGVLGIIGNFSNVWRQTHVKWRCQNMGFAASNGDACPIVLSARRRLSMSILVYSPHFRAPSRTNDL